MPAFMVPLTVSRYRSGHANRPARDHSVSAWHLRWIYEALPAPTFSQEPVSSRCHRAESSGLAPRRTPLPAIEPGSGRCDVEHHGRSSSFPLTPVLACIEQNVGKSIPDFARRSQNAQVITTEQHGPHAPEHPVHRSRQPDSYGLHPATERFLSGRLDHEMDMIRLDRVMAHPELASLASSVQPRLELANEAPAAKRRNAAPHAQRHVS